jgi:hypothetical protein
VPEGEQDVFEVQGIRRDREDGIDLRGGTESFSGREVVRDGVVAGVLRSLDLIPAPEPGEL